MHLCVCPHICKWITNTFEFMVQHFGSPEIYLGCVCGCKSFLCVRMCAYDKFVSFHIFLYLRDSSLCCWASTNIATSKLSTLYDIFFSFVSSQILQILSHCSLGYYFACIPSASLFTLSHLTSFSRSCTLCFCLSGCNLRIASDE